MKEGMIGKYLTGMLNASHLEGNNVIKSAYFDDSSSKNSKNSS